MRSALRAMSAGTKNRLFGALFTAEALLAMFPPVYWWVASVDGNVLGMPFAMFYFVVVGALVCATIVAIYVTEEIRDEVE
jgi:hypothetical protein